MSLRRVVITGMSVITPLGQNLTEVWRDLCSGKSGISNIEAFNTTDYKVHIAGEIKNFDPAPHIDPREQKRLDRFAQFGLLASTLAVEDSGIDFGKEDPFRCGANIGSGIGGLKELEEAYDKLAQQGPSKLSPLVIPRMIINSASGTVAIRYGLRGPTSAVAAACASAAISVGEAFRAIQHGEADVMITGGSEAAITPLGLGGFAALRALSQRNDSPQSASRPFERDRDGFVLSEGAGVVVLEEYEHARARGARIYAELLGYGATCDGIHITAPDPEGRGAANAMNNALRDASMSAGDVEYVNAHGTGTLIGDRAETQAVKLVFGNHAKELMVSSTKSQIGHLLGASGGVELAFSALSVYDGIVPPTINMDEPDPECDLDYVPNEGRSEPVILAMSNSFGFGGHNASLLVGALDKEPSRGKKAA